MDWDKQSSSSISELSVANLQDRINQMEETHYSTSEELQATLQELNDLQEQVTELQFSNEQLELDKSFLLETLCAQTKKFEICTNNVDKLKKMIIDQYNDQEKQSILSPTDREEQLVEMLKILHEEKIELEQKQNELLVKLEEANSRIRLEQESNIYDLG